MGFKTRKKFHEISYLVFLSKHKMSIIRRPLRKNITCNNEDNGRGEVIKRPLTSKLRAEETRVEVGFFTTLQDRERKSPSGITVSTPFREMEQISDCKTSAANKSGYCENSHMIKFVQQEFEKRHGSTSADNNYVEPLQNSEDAFLYTIPDHLKGIERCKRTCEANGWLTGIQEVKLPQDFRFQNIEDTEIAKQHLLENISTDMIDKRYKTEYKNVNKKRKNQNQIDIGQNDEKLASRFKKRVSVKQRVYYMST